MRTAATGAVVAPGSVAASTTSVVPATGLTNVQLRSRGSWKCADVRGPSSADDTVVQQWSCNTPAVSQQSVDLVADGGVSEMRVRFRNANKCAQARSGDTVTQNTCDGGSDQRWKFTERPGGWRIESKWNSKCLAATGGDGTGLTLTACADVAVQLWSITSPSDGSIVEVDGSGSTTVTYLRDASDGLVQRSLNGAVTGRYAATAGGAPSAVLNASNTAVAATVGLPGGTSHSFDPRIGVLNGTWQHPNLTGHRVATTNTAGAKVGATTVYDPDGNLQAGTLPDDKPGNFDAAWHGGGGVNLEHEPGLHPMIQMGARQYSPILARFLEIDPVEGGVNNDYGYVEDPINISDLSGMWAIGACMDVSVGFIVVATLTVCFWVDDAGGELWSYSVGGGVGADTSAGAQTMASNVRSVGDLLGWAWCSAAGAGPAAASGCTWGRYWTAGIGFGIGGAPLTGALTRSKTMRLPGWAPRPNQLRDRARKEADKRRRSDASARYGGVAK